MKLCECGCGTVVKNRFARNHSSRILNPFPKGSKHTPEVCSLLSKIKNEFWASPEGTIARKRLSDSRRGTASPKRGIPNPCLIGDNNPARRSEVREKIRISKLGNRNPMKRPEVVALATANRRASGAYSPEWKLRISRTRRERIAAGLIASRKGFKCSKEAREQMSLRRQGMYQGSKNPNWRGGISWEEYPKGFWDVRLQVLERDRHTCQVCDSTIRMSVHHIDYNKKNNSVTNLLAVCTACNSRLNFNRELWIKAIKDSNNWAVTSQLIKTALYMGTSLARETR